MIFTLIITTVFLWLVANHYRRVSRLPPGPFSLPIIGNLHQVLFYSWTTGGIVPFLNLMRKRYGKMFTVWLGPLPHVSVTDFDTAQEIFVKHGSKYADKFFSPIFNKARNECGIVAVNGPYWQEVRRFSLQTLRNMGVGKDLMETRIMEELDARCAALDESAKNGVSIVKAASFFDLTVGSIINSILMGTRFEEHQKHEFLHLKRLIDEGAKLVGPFELMLPLWVLTTFFKKKYEFAMKGQLDTMDYLARTAVKKYEDVRDGKLSIDEENPNDYVDSFILKMLQADSNKQVFNVTSLKAILTDLWMTGQETTSTTLVSGFINLLNHPEVMDRMRSELMAVTSNGARSLSLSDRNDTPYLNAVIAEIQRLASILNVNFWKINHELEVYGGHPVDSGALISAQLCTIHEDERTFPDPKKFDPERFIRDPELAQKLIQFGVGKRACTGEGLARAELFLILGNLILRYKFEAHGRLPTDIDVAPFSFAKKPDNEYEMKFIKI